MYIDAICKLPVSVFFFLYLKWLPLLDSYHYSAPPFIVCSKENYRTNGENVEEMTQCLAYPGFILISIPYSQKCLNFLRVFHGHRNSAL